MVISIPSTCRVFVLDDTEDRLNWFRERLPQARTAKTAYEAIEILAAEPFDVVFLDHDLGFLDAADPRRQHGNGKEVARFLAIRKFPGRIVIHSRNLDAVPLMQKILPHAKIAPFGEFEITVAAQVCER
jgi:hypothetical protein